MPLNQFGLDYLDDVEGYGMEEDPMESSMPIAAPPDYSYKGAGEWLDGGGADKSYLPTNASDAAMFQHRMQQRLGYDNPYNNYVDQMFGLNSPGHAGALDLAGVEGDKSLNEFNAGLAWQNELDQRDTRQGWQADDFATNQAQLGVDAANQMSGPRGALSEQGFQRGQSDIALQTKPQTDQTQSIIDRNNSMSGYYDRMPQGGAGIDPEVRQEEAALEQIRHFVAELVGRCAMLMVWLLIQNCMNSLSKGCSVCQIESLEHQLHNRLKQQQRPVKIRLVSLR